MRDGEINKVDYDFLTPEEYENRKSKMFETVEYQFEDKYGGEYSNLSINHWNCVVVSIEGFISAMKHMVAGDKAILLNILRDNGGFVKREGRDADNEERINKAVLANFKEGNLIKMFGSECVYLETNTTDLPSIESMKNKEFFQLITSLNKITIREKMRSCRTKEELAEVFMESPERFGNSNDDERGNLDCLAVNAERLGSSLKEIVTKIAMKKLREKANGKKCN